MKHSLSFAFCLLTLSTQAMAEPAAPSLVTVVTNDEKEKLLSDGTGRTLYVFDADLGKTVPACNGDCAEVWPPYLVTKEEAVALKAPLAAAIRANGKLQLLYQTRPVYTYALDRKVGDDRGDKIGGVWHYIEIKP